MEDGVPRISISYVDTEKVETDPQNDDSDEDSPRMAIELPFRKFSFDSPTNSDSESPRKRRFRSHVDKDGPRKDSILAITLLSSKDDPRHSWNRHRASSLANSTPLTLSTSPSMDNLAAADQSEPKEDAPDQIQSSRAISILQASEPAPSEQSKLEVPNDIQEKQSISPQTEEKVEQNTPQSLPKRAKKFLKKQITFFRVHLLYFLAVDVIGSLIIYGIERPRKTSYVDCLFTATSALTVTGLSSVDFSQMRVGSQVVVMLLIFLGGNILMTLPLVLLRRYYYKKFVEEQANEIELQIKTVEGIAVLVSPQPKAFLKGRWSIEYHALTKLAIIVCMYFVVIVSFGFLTMKIHFATTRPLTGISEWWVAIFHTISSLNNAGFALFADNLMQFYNDTYVPLLLSFLIMAGNTMFPVFLRLAIWSVYMIKKKLGRSDVEIYEYILQNPRRIFTHLFVGYQTRALFFINGGFILVELIAFLSLDWNTKGTEHLSTYNKFICGWFQSVSTRTAGFNIVDISLLNPAIWTLYAALMYIAAYPVTFAVRASEEQEEETTFQNTPLVSRSAWKTVSMKLLLRDLSWIFTVLFAICVAESSRISNDPNFNIFKILFEIASAYGTVGLTLGYPGSVVSFSGYWTDFSKVALCIIMLLGRHRGLPDNIDRAVTFPSHLHMLEIARQESKQYTVNETNMQSEVKK